MKAIRLIIEIIIYIGIFVGFGYGLKSWASRNLWPERIILLIAGISSLFSATLVSGLYFYTHEIPDPEVRDDSAIENLTMITLWAITLFSTFMLTLAGAYLRSHKTSKLKS